METSTPQYRYWAFVSYSNHDRSWGRWLHRAIESYGIPAKLVNSLTPVGHPAPKRLRPLFRDREELPAASDLSARIDDALRASRYLIVICSKHASRSNWVNKEIETFQKLGRNDRILAIIVDGEPNSGDDRECFPPALRKCEPIAADARADGDGKTNAKLKLLAGMLGVSFDSLKQRDVRRRNRRMQIVLCASLLLTAAFASLSVYANHQRLAAVDRMADLRLMVKKLLWNLVDEIDTMAGPLAYKDALLTGAESYLSELVAESKGEKGAERELAITYEKMGGVRFEQGKLEDARKSYDRGLVIAQRLVDLDGSNANYRLDAVALNLGIGTVCRQQGRLNEAKERFYGSLDSLDLMGRKLPDYEPLRNFKAEIHRRLALVHLEQGNTEEAWRNLAESEKLFEILAGGNPRSASYAVELAETYVQLAKLFYVKSDSDQAIGYGRKSVGICDRVVQNLPYHRAGLNVLAMAHAELSKDKLKTGEVTASAYHAEEALKYLQTLLVSDPMSAVAQLGLAEALVNHAVVLRQMGRNEKSAEQLYKAKELSEAVLMLDSSNAAAKAVEALACGHLAIVRALSGSKFEGRSFSAAFFELVREMRSADWPVGLELQQLELQVGGLAAK